MKPKLTTGGAAKAVGISRDTLQRWIRDRRVRAPKPILRNGRGVRLWSAADVRRLKKVKERTYWVGRGGSKKKKKKA